MQLNPREGTIWYTISQTQDPIHKTSQNPPVPTTPWIFNTSSVHLKDYNFHSNLSFSASYNYLRF